MNKNLIKKASLVLMSGLLPISASAGEVSISGWVNEEMMVFDTPAGSDVAQVSGNGITLGSRITFAGTQDLGNGLTSGFEVIVEPQDPTQPLLGTETGLSNVNGLGDALGVLGHMVYLSGSMGKISMGLLSTATDNIAVLGDPSLTLWSSIAIPYHNAGFSAGTIGGTAATYAQFLHCNGIGLGIGSDCNGIYRNAVRWDLPTFIEGVGIATSFANDDIFDVAVKWDGDLGGVKALVHGGYSMINDTKTDLFQVQFGLMDPGTGLFGTAALMFEDADLAAVGDGGESYWFKAGIKKSFNSLGDTAIAFQYGLYDDMIASSFTGAVTGSEVDRYGVEVVQYLGGGLQIYALYENMDLDVDVTAGTAVSVDSTDTFVLGTTYFF